MLRSDELKSWTISKMKHTLRGLKLRLTGNKSDLFPRVMEARNVSTNQINASHTALLDASQHNTATQH